MNNLNSMLDINQLFSQNLKINHNLVCGNELYFYKYIQLNTSFLYFSFNNLTSVISSLKILTTRKYSNCILLFWTASNSLDFSLMISSCGLINRNHKVLLSNLSQARRLNFLSPYEECFSCYEDKPYLLQYHQRFQGFLTWWTVFSFCEFDQRGYHFKGTQWRVGTCLLWYKYPCKGRCLGVWDHWEFPTI